MAVGDPELQRQTRRRRRSRRPSSAALPAKQVGDVMEGASGEPETTAAACGAAVEEEKDRVLGARGTSFTMLRGAAVENGRREGRPGEPSITHDGKLTRRDATALSRSRRNNWRRDMTHWVCERGTGAASLVKVHKDPEDPSDDALHLGHQLLAPQVRGGQMSSRGGGLEQDEYDANSDTPPSTNHSLDGEPATQMTLNTLRGRKPRAHLSQGVSGIQAAATASTGSPPLLVTSR
ncbi:hypothetical protein V8D89_006149 [Ganoderma adspersum]